MDYLANSVKSFHIVILWDKLLRLLIQQFLYVRWPSCCLTNCAKTLNNNNCNIIGINSRILLLSCYHHSKVTQYTNFLHEEMQYKTAANPPSMPANSNYPTTSGSSKTVLYCTSWCIG